MPELRELLFEFLLGLGVAGATGLLDRLLDGDLGVVDVALEVAGTLLGEHPLEAPHLGLQGRVLATPLSPQPAGENEEPGEDSQSDEEQVRDHEGRGAGPARGPRLLAADPVDRRVDGHIR